MALTYDLTAMKDRETLHESDDQWLVTKAIIFHSMGVRLAELTDENASEWYARAHFQEHDLGETMLFAAQNDPPESRKVREGRPDGYILSPEDIRLRIGITTNAWPNVARREWIRNIVRRVNESQFYEQKYTYREVRERLSEYADAYLAHVSQVAS